MACVAAAAARPKWPAGSLSEGAGGHARHGSPAATPSANNALAWLPSLRRSSSTTGRVVELESAQQSRVAQACVKRQETPGHDGQLEWVK